MNDERGEFRGYMTSGELSSFLGISPRVMRDRRLRGKIPEPAQRTPNGWGLWSPDQCTVLLDQELERRR
jgi:hypothetical protein